MKVLQPSARLTPKTHQLAAEGALVAELRARGRAQLHAPCGSGKTLIGALVSERLVDEGLVLYLTPSIALLSQTLMAWLDYLPGLEAAVVCSDQTAGYDDPPLESSHLPAPVITEPSQIRAFGKAEGFRVLFSTYQSTHVVAAALKRSSISVELAIFDEAHVAATLPGNCFSRALSDKSIRCRKRLFMTATPRLFDPPAEQAASPAKKPLSMNDEALFGRIAYRMSFRAAVAKEIITDYRVLVSDVEKPEVEEAIATGGGIIGQRGDGMVADAARAVALVQGIRRTGASKVITYHNRVEDAERFSREWKAYFRAGLPGYRILHVNGTMSAAEREKIMDEFATSERAIVTNARCLGVGVDVPSVDMVAFLAARRGFLDIVQNVGRALRTSPGKRVGYILLPLFLDGDREDGRERFSEIFSVLDAMRHSDEALAFSLDAATRRLAREDGEGQLDDDHVEFISRKTTFAQVRKAVVTAFLRERGSTWHRRYGQLEQFHRKNGHLRIPREGATAALSRFCVQQRKDRKSGLLPAERIALLDALGFVWTLQTELAGFQRHLQTVQRWVARGGKARDRKAPAEVRTSVAYLARRTKSGRVPEACRAALDALGLSADTLCPELVDERNIQALDAYYTKTGCWSPPASSPDLVDWAADVILRLRGRGKRIAPDVKKRLLTSPAIQEALSFAA